MKKQLIGCAIGALLLAGCAMPAGALRQKYKTVQSYSVCEFTAQGDANQKSGEIAVSATIASFPVTQASCEEMEITGYGTPNAMEVRIQQYDVVTPPAACGVVFEINNASTHSIKLGGAGVQVKVNGEKVQLPAFVSDETVLGGDSAKIKAAGPSLTQIPDGAIVSVTLHDVVTQVDAAGNPVRRENFAWKFKCVKGDREHEVVTRYGRGTLSPEASMQALRLRKIPGSSMRVKLNQYGQLVPSDVRGEFGIKSVAIQEPAPQSITQQPESNKAPVSSQQQ